MQPAHTCRLCGMTTETPAAFCSQCGNALTGAPVATAPKSKWYHNLLVVFGMLVMLGPFGLPLVWKNPRLGRGMKWGLTLVTIAVTVWLVIVTLQIAHTVMNDVTQFNSTLRF